MKQIADAGGGDQRAALLSAMRRGEVRWRGFVDEPASVSPDAAAAILGSPLMIASLAKSGLPRKIVEIGSAIGGNHVLAGVGVEGIDWGTSAFQVGERRVFDICVAGIPSTQAGSRDQAAKRRDARDERAREVIAKAREDHPELSGNKIAELVHDQFGEEIGLGVEALRKMVRGNYRKSAG